MRIENGVKFRERKFSRLCLCWEGEKKEKKTEKWVRKEPCPVFVNPKSDLKAENMTRGKIW